MTRPRRSRTAAATAGALCLLLAACSGGSSSAAPARPTSTASASRSAPATPASGTPTSGTPTSGTPTSGGATSGAGTASGTPDGTDAAGTGTTAPTATGTTAAPAAAPGELPRGGRTLFPRYRLVGYSGAPGSTAFGRLGVGNLDERVREIEKRGRAYDADREVLPVLELITVIANAHPGPDGDYATQVGDATIRRYLAAARRHRALLLLDVQPGRADFLDVVRRLRPWLEQPDVGLALDPEWAVEPGQVPGAVYGRTTGKELDSVARYLDRIVREKALPQKVLVFHQVAARVVRRQEAITEHPGVAVIKSVDGIGSREAKIDTWRVLVRDLPPAVHSGFKLFFDEDTRHGPLMTPKQVLALRPQPEYVLYE
jgi:hypothetical protein